MQKKIEELFAKLGITNDKTMHFICGAMFSVLLGLFLTNALYGVLVGIFAGVGKEIYDYYDYGLFDCKDMFAT